MQTVSVLIVDDVSAVRQDLRTALTLSGGIEVVGEAANGDDAIRQVAALHPQVALMDLEMPVMDGYEATRQIKLQSPACRVIALTVHGYAEARQKAMQSGVDSFFVKGMPIETLVKRIMGQRENGLELTRSDNEWGNCGREAKN